MIINLNESQAEFIIEMLTGQYGDEDTEYQQGYIAATSDLLSILKISLKNLNDLSKESSINNK